MLKYVKDKFEYTLHAIFLGLCEKLKEKIWLQKKLIIFSYKIDKDFLNY